MCIGYTIKSVGPNSSKGTLCQQAQDFKYKLSGLQRVFAGKIGSATFPHEAISIRDRKLLIKTFETHPGFSVSEVWFFGHVARQLGCRIQMCTAVFVETETPDSMFFRGAAQEVDLGSRSHLPCTPNTAGRFKDDHLQTTILSLELFLRVWHLLGYVTRR